MASFREENPVPLVPPPLRGLRPTTFASLPIFPSLCHSLVPAPPRTDQRYFSAPFSRPPFSRKTTIGLAKLSSTREV